MIEIPFSTLKHDDNYDWIEEWCTVIAKCLDEAILEDLIEKTKNPVDSRRVK